MANLNLDHNVAITRERTYTAAQWPNLIPLQLEIKMRRYVLLLTSTPLRRTRNKTRRAFSTAKLAFFYRKQIDRRWFFLFAANAEEMDRIVTARSTDYTTYWSTRPTHIHGRKWSLFSHMLSVLTFQNLASFKRKQCLLLARLWLWPSGSLTTPHIYICMCTYVHCQKKKYGAL